MTISLEGRSVLITGAGRGLGRAHALELARRGARIVVNDYGVTRGGDSPDGTAAEAVVAEIRALGGEAIANTDSVAEVAGTRRMVEAALDSFGRLDAIVANAGINRLAPFEEMSLADFHDIVSTHLFGTVNVVHAGYPALRRAPDARILLTSSQIAWGGKADSPAYGVAKGGILGLLATLRMTAPAHGILVNCLAPFAFTRAGEGVFPEALRPLLDPAQVSALVAWLVSTECRENGRIFIAGGGHFAAAETRETVGIDIVDPDAITTESLAARVDEILDPTDAILYDDALLAVGATFARLKKLAGID